MTDSYYLINDQIKFYFDIENLRIEFNGACQSLEPKEARILKYVLENQVDGLIKSESILDDNWEYWSDKKVLQKVLSTLRKKFKSIGVTENGFVAADSNYKINFNAVLVNDTKMAQKDRKALWLKVYRYIKFTIPILIAVLLTIIAVGQFNGGPKYTVTNIVQSTTIGGVSVEPSLSSDGRALAFTHRRDDQSQIYVKIDDNLNFQILTEGYRDQVPSWSPSGRLLAFQRVSGGQCEIRLIKLDEHYNKVGDEEVLTQCNSVTGLTSITWKDEQTLFFSDTKEGTYYRQIMQLDVSRKTITPYFVNKSVVDTKNTAGSGHYYIVYNHQLDSLFSLTSPDWEVARINKVNDNNTVTVLREVGSVIMSFDIYENQVIFKDLDNQLKSFDIDDDTLLTTVYRYPLKPIAYPVVSPGSNHIAMVSGSVFKHSVHTYSLADKTSNKLFTSETLVYHPQVYGEEVLFLSQETGINQIYSFKSGVKTQITNFNRNDNILYFTMSNNRKWIAISFADRTSVYQRNDAGLVLVKSFELRSEPAFSHNSERILVSGWLESNDGENKTKEKALVEYYVDGFVETGISIRDAKFGVYHKSGIIYPTFDNQLKLFKLNGIDTIASDLNIASRSVVGLSDNHFVVSFQTVHKPIMFNLDTYERVELDVPISSQIALSNGLIYYRQHSPGSMVIFKGELLEQ